MRNADNQNNISGERLKQALKDSNLTQKELGEAIGYTGQYISDLCRGKRPMTAQAAQFISEKLNVRSEFLLGEDDYPTQSALILDKLYSFFSEASKWDLERMKRVSKLEGICKEAVEIYGFSEIYSEIPLGDVYPLGFYMDEILKNALETYFKMYAFSKGMKKYGDNPKEGEK